MTKLCISLSMKPGRFGETVHNAGYKALQIDYQYKAFYTQDIVGAIAGVRALGIRGCSISMPFKESVLDYIDSVDDIAADIGAVNSIVNENGYLKGFNTDIVGVVQSLTPYLTDNSNSIMILGGGGVARAILKALQILCQRNVTMCVRNPQKYQALAKQFGANLVEWSLRHSVNADVIINATPIGMLPHSDVSPIDLDKLSNVKLVMDLVVAPETALIKQARARNTTVINGLTMALYQAYEQFYLYTGITAPREVMSKAATSM